MVDFLKGKLTSNSLRLVFPEGENLKILKVASKLNQKGMCKVILLGEKSKILDTAKDNNLSLEGIEIIDPLRDSNLDFKADILYEIRKGKNTREECLKMIKSSNYYGVMVVKMGLADALLGGVTYSTADIVRPALQIIRAKEGTKTVSSSFLMIKDNNKMIMSDCAIVVNPTSDQLTEITIASVDTARLFDIEPSVALLSYSTHGSGRGVEVDKVKEAVRMLEDKQVDFNFDGELQFDTAMSKEVRDKKSPGSRLLNDANVLIFPNLESGNIGYKIAARLGGYKAIGPILQGLGAPINDLSRGSSEEEIYLLSLISLLQAQNNSLLFE